MLKLKVLFSARRNNAISHNLSLEISLLSHFCRLWVSAGNLEHHQIFGLNCFHRIVMLMNLSSSIFLESKRWLQNTVWTTQNYTTTKENSAPPVPVVPEAQQELPTSPNNTRVSLRKVTGSSQTNPAEHTIFSVEWLFFLCACKACEMMVSDFSRNKKSRSSRLAQQIHIPSPLAYPRATHCFMKELSGTGTPPLSL